jgi:hypothetical protein
MVSHPEVISLPSNSSSIGIKPMPLLDNEGQVFAVFAGWLEEEGYLQCCQEFFMVLECLGDCTHFPKECLQHRHENYLALDSGVTHGPGSPTITNTISKSSLDGLDDILASKPLRCILGFCDGM